MKTHIHIIAWLNIALGTLTFLGAGLAFLFFSVLGLAIGGADPSAWPAVALFGGLGFFLLCVVGVFAIPNLILGWGLLNYAPWARILGIILSILTLFNPTFFGIIVGAYTLVILFNPETIDIFERRVASPSHLSSL